MLGQLVLYISFARLEVGKHVRVVVMGTHPSTKPNLLVTTPLECRVIIQMLP